MPEPTAAQFRRATARYATGIAVVTTISPTAWTTP